MACYFEGRDESPVVLLDPVERYECDEVGDILAISPYAKDVVNELEYSMIKNWKSTCQQFLQRWYLALLKMWVIRGIQSLPLALSQKKSKLYRRFVIMMATLMTKASTTLYNSLLNIKNKSSHFHWLFHKKCKTILAGRNNDDYIDKNLEYLIW